VSAHASIDQGGCQKKKGKMNGLENHSYLVLLIVFNLIAMIFLVAAVKIPKTSRFLFFLLFSWACVVNWVISQRSPGDYLEYADLAISGGYRDLIRGWFSKHISLVVGIIATCQGLIAISMLLKGRVFRLGCIGGIIFLLAIAPLGVGSGFPCTITFAIAMVILFKKGTTFLWSRKKGEVLPA
jgi:hypothetical protein